MGIVTFQEHNFITMSSIMMYRASLVMVAMALCPTEASYGYGGSGQAYMIPGTEPRAMPGIYKQEYMQPVYTTSYPVHHDQHVSPVQYVTVAPTSGHHHAPAVIGHGYAAAPAVSHGHTVAPVVSFDNTAAHLSHGHNVAPAISHGYTPVYQLARPAPIKSTSSHEHGSIPSHGYPTYY